MFYEKHWVITSPTTLGAYMGKNIICDALRDLVPFVQFKKREKHTWKSFILSKVADF